MNNYDKTPNTAAEYTIDPPCQLCGCHVVFLSVKDDNMPAMLRALRCRGCGAERGDLPTFSDTFNYNN